MQTKINLSLPSINENAVSEVLISSLRFEVQKTGLRKAVIGLSGGIDSALSLVLAQKALGSENVHAIMMPYKLSSTNSLVDAKKQCDALGVNYSIEEITEMADGYVNPHPELSRLQIGNILARLRMMVLYDYSASQKALVIGTSNKTEALVGYTTLWGDMACAINPLGDLYKTYVKKISKYMGIIKEILEKPPSADLWPGQTDESEMNVTYDEIDLILYLFMELHWNEKKIIQSLPQIFVNKAEIILQRVKKSQFKRIPPVILKVTQRTIGREFRFPRDWES